VPPIVSHTQVGVGRFAQVAGRGFIIRGAAMADSPPRRDFAGSPGNLGLRYVHRAPNPPGQDWQKPLS